MPRPLRKEKRGKKSEEPSSPKTTGRSWGAVAARKEQTKNSGNYTKEFFLRDGESAIIQFLDDEPYCVEGYQLKLNGRWKFYTSQLLVKKSCSMANSGAKSTWRAGFRVIDYRGKWDSDKKKFVGEPVEKLWLCSNGVAQIIENLDKKSKKPLTERVFEVTRTGSKTNTTYNMQTAFDEDDEKMEPMEWEPELDELEVLMKPPTDDELRAAGFNFGEEEGDFEDDEDEDF